MPREPSYSHNTQHLFFLQFSGVSRSEISPDISPFQDRIERKQHSTTRNEEHRQITRPSKRPSEWNHGPGESLETIRVLVSPRYRFPTVARWRLPLFAGRKERSTKQLLDRKIPVLRPFPARNLSGFRAASATSALTSIYSARSVQRLLKLGWLDRSERSRRGFRPVASFHPWPSATRKWIKIEARPRVRARGNWSAIDKEKQVHWMKAPAEDTLGSR